MMNRPNYEVRYPISKTIAVAVLAFMAAVGIARTAGSDYDAQGTGRRPLVVVAGVTEQLPTADYISTIGGLTTNGTAASAGDIQSTTETVSTSLTAQGQISWSGSISPASLTGVQVDNYTPAGLSGAYVVDQVVTANTTITGLLAQPVGTLIDFRNNSTSTGTLLFKNASTSLAANQFKLSGAVDWKLPPGCSILFRYMSSGDWRMLALITTDMPSLTIDGAATIGTGLTITSGGETITAGGLTISAGGENVTGNSTFNNNLTVSGTLDSSASGAVTALGNVTYTTQTSSATGTQNDVALTSNTTVFTWSGASNTSFTGFAGGVAGRVLVINNPSTHTMTLSNLTGSSAANQLQNWGNVSLALVGNNSSATYIYDGAVSKWRMIAFESTQIDATGISFKASIATTGVSGTTVSMTTGVATNGRDGHFRAIVSTPNTGTCGTSATLSATTDAAGTVTIGTTSGGNCTINFNTTYTNAPACLVRFHDATTNSAFSYSTTATTLAITGASDSKTFDYFCVGNV